MDVVIDNELLIHCVQTRPVLWDKTLESFKDRNATRNAWHEVCLELLKDFDNLEDSKKNDFGTEVMKRWKHLRDAFIRSEKNFKQSKASGSQASERKKYIFNDELQFLRKIYKERETEESYDNEDDEIAGPSAASVLTEVTEIEGSTKVVVSKAKPPARQHKKMDDVDLKILRAMEQTEPEKENDKLQFFESLLPHVDKFDDNQWLQCQMEFLQVISKIKNSYPCIPQPRNVQNHSTSQIQQFNQQSILTQAVNVPYMSQRAFANQMLSPQYPAQQMSCFHKFPAYFK